MAKKNIPNISKLFLIGGGVMRNGETEKIDKWLLSRVKNGSQKPKVLFIPAASDDLEAYIASFTQIYESYGAKVSVLRLVKDSPPAIEIKKKILSSDMVYFGGGSAEVLLSCFKKYSLNEVCIEASQNGVLVGGLSAGAIIWGKKFLTFDRQGSNFINFRVLKGLNWIPNILIPHFSKNMLKNKIILPLVDKKLALLGIAEKEVVYWDNCHKKLFR